MPQNYTWMQRGKEGIEIALLEFKTIKMGITGVKEVQWFQRDYKERIWQSDKQTDEQIAILKKETKNILCGIVNMKKLNLINFFFEMLSQWATITNRLKKFNSVSNKNRTHSGSLDVVTF